VERLLEIKLVISKSVNTAELLVRIVSIEARAAIIAAALDAPIADFFASDTLLPVAFPDPDAVNVNILP
jgi:hypothetical protein